MRSTFATNDLQRIASVPAIPDFVRSWENALKRPDVARAVAERRLFVRSLTRRFGSELWAACRRAAGPPRQDGLTWLEWMAHLPGAHQVVDPEVMEEFVVHHALRQLAREELASAHSLFASH